MIIDLKKDDIDRLFIKANTVSEYLSYLYELVIPDWNNVSSMPSTTVSVNPKTNKYLISKAISFDKSSGIEEAGIVLLNKGFSNSEDVPEWKAQVLIEEIEYNEKKRSMIFNIILVAETICKDESSCINNIYTFSTKDTKKAEDRFIQTIIENNVNIADDEHKNALLEDGHCDLPNGGVDIWHDILEIK